jgi:drug/metabolite transporter (DMT)-like permease
MSVILRYYALQYLSVGDVSVITGSTPLVVTIMGHFLLGEKCGVVSAVVAFGLLGAIVIETKPHMMMLSGMDFDTDTLVIFKLIGFCTM